MSASLQSQQKTRKVGVQRGKKPQSPGVPKEDHSEISLQGRDPHLPCIFRIGSHVLISEELKPHVCNIYVVMKDTSPEAQEKFEEVMKNIEVPAGPNQNMRRFGLLRLHQGDIMFVRDMHGSGEQKDD
ncbi:hypothetical protein PM082_019844 [Marasmius tenuissimus]|nr:hypothetical protein PM082_019844 [Marasmius tenuissimus]